MSMPQVLLSIRQHRHTRCKLVRVGVWGWAGAGAPGGDASAAGRSLARQRLGLSQFQQLVEPQKPVYHEGAAYLAGAMPASPPPSCNTGGKSIQPLKMVDIGFRLVPNSETPMVITGISFECPCLNLLHPLLPNETDCL